MKSWQPRRMTDGNKKKVKLMVMEVKAKRRRRKKLLMEESRGDRAVEGGDEKWALKGRFRSLRSTRGQEADEEEVWGTR